MVKLHISIVKIIFDLSKNI